MAGLAVENTRLRAELAFYRAVVENDSGRLYEAMLAGLPPARRHYAAEPAAHAALAVVPATAEVHDG